MVGGEGEFHCHVLAILSSHPLQLLRVLDVHRLEEQRRNVRFSFSHKISSKRGDSWRSLRKKVTLEETCIICNFIFSTSAARACDILLYLSACLSLFNCCQKSALQRPRWMWTYVARSTNRLSLLLAGARKFQLSFLLLRTPVLSRAGRQPSSTIARALFA